MTQRSESELRRVISAGSCDPYDYLELANLLKRRNHNNEALAVYRQALNMALSPRDAARISWELGELLHAVQGPGPETSALAAENLRLLAQERDEPDTLALRGLNEALMAQALWDASEDSARAHLAVAIQTLERVITTPSREPDALTPLAEYELARCYLAAGQYEAAERACKRYLSRDLEAHDRTNGLSLLADAFVASHKWDDAEALLQRLLADSSISSSARPHLLTQIGLVRRNKGHTRGAIEAFEGALSAMNADINPTTRRDLRRRVVFELAELHYDAGDVRRATDLFNTLLEEYHSTAPERFPILNWLGMCYAEMGQAHTARRFFDEVLRSERAADADKAHAREWRASLS